MGELSLGVSKLDRGVSELGCGLDELVRGGLSFNPKKSLVLPRLPHPSSPCSKCFFAIVVIVRRPQVVERRRIPVATLKDAFNSPSHHFHRVVPSNRQNRAKGPAKHALTMTSLESPKGKWKISGHGPRRRAVGEVGGPDFGAGEVARVAPLHNARTMVKRVNEFVTQNAAEGGREGGRVFTNDDLIVF